MSKRYFWIRSASPRWSEGLTPPWMIQGLIGDYPGYMGRMSVFVSALESRHIPHPLETHDQEEMLVNLSGGLDLLAGERTHRLGPGGFVHVPPGVRHRVQAVGPEPSEFLVFKWTWQNVLGANPNATTFVLEGHGLDRADDQAGIYRRRVCENQPLANGGRMVIETFRVPPQTGYPLHSHDHDLMFVLLGGQMHGLGHTTSAPAVIYYPAGTMHGLQPVNQDPIEMIAFEFHRPSP
jgi:quercetin dioxygenase-like cupin family protein